MKHVDCFLAPTVIVAVYGVLKIISKVDTVQVCSSLAPIAVVPPGWMNGACT